MSEGKEDGTVGEIEDEECSKEQVDSHIQQRSSSIPRLRNSVPTTHSSPTQISKTQQSSPNEVQQS